MPTKGSFLKLSLLLYFLVTYNQPPLTVTGYKIQNLRNSLTRIKQLYLLLITNLGVYNKERRFNDTKNIHLKELFDSFSTIKCKEL